jgi:hypothetical protein
VATNPGVVSDKTRHIDAQRQVIYSAASGNITWDPATRRCTGTCHNKNHNDAW